MLTNHKIFVVSAPSGSGKLTVIEEVRKCVPDLYLTKSLTTRPRLPGDKDEYWHISIEEFERRLEKSEFAEHALVHGNYYGTPTRELFLYPRCIVEVNTDGARQLKAKYPEEVHTIFILPPSPEEQKKRLYGRERGESKEELARRLEEARREIAAAHTFDHWEVNDDLKKCVAQVGSLILKHNLNRSANREGFLRDLNELNRVKEAFGVPILV